MLDNMNSSMLALQRIGWCATLEICIAMLQTTCPTNGKHSQSCNSLWHSRTTNVLFNLRS